MQNAKPLMLSDVFTHIEQGHHPPPLADRQRLISKHSPPPTCHSLGSTRRERPGPSPSPRFALPDEPAPRHSPALARSEPRGTGHGHLLPSCTSHETPRSLKGMRREGRGTLHSPRIASSRHQGKPCKVASGPRSTA